MNYRLIAGPMAVALILSSTQTLAKDSLLEIREASWGTGYSWKNVTKTVQDQLAKKGGKRLNLSNQTVKASNEIPTNLTKTSWQTTLFGTNGSPVWGLNKVLRLRYFDGKQEKTLSVNQGDPLIIEAGH